MRTGRPPADSPLILLKEAAFSWPNGRVVTAPQTGNVLAADPRRARLVT